MMTYSFVISTKRRNLIKLVSFETHYYGISPSVEMTTIEAYV